MRIRTLVRALAALALILAVVAPAAAQGTTGNSGVLVGAGVSFLRVSETTSTGLAVDVRKNVYNATSFDLGIVGDLSWHRRSLEDDPFEGEVDGSSTILMGLVGGRITASQMDRVAPFGQILFGLVRQSVSGDLCDFLEAFDESCSSSDGAMSFGGGVDVRLNEKWNFRGQIDFIKLFVDESDIATRFFLGVSTKIGG